MRNFSLDDSPFSKLRVSPRARLADIEDAFEDTVIEDAVREQELLRSKQALLSPNVRLEAEIGWPTDAAPRRVQEVLDLLQKGEKHLVRAAIVDLPPLAAANISADAAERFLDATFVAWLIKAHDELKADALQALLNSVRATAGFPQVSSDQVVTALKALRKRHAAAAIAALASQQDPARFLAMAWPTFPDPHAAFVAELMRAYDHWSSPHLAGLERDVEEHCGAVLSDVAGAVSQLCASLEAWDALSQPAQLFAQASGLDEERTLRIYRRVRSACVDLANEQSRYAEAHTISGAMRDLFYELPTARAQLDEDLDALWRLADEAAAKAAVEGLSAVLAEARGHIPSLAVELAIRGLRSNSSNSVVKRIWAALQDSHVKLGGQDRTDAALVSVRDLALDLNNEFHEPRAALAILEGALQAAPARNPTTAELIHRDIEKLRKILDEERITEALRGKRFGEAITLLDALLANPLDSAERTRLQAMREQIQQVRNRRATKWVVWGGIAAAGVVAVLADSNPTPSSAPLYGASSDAGTLTDAAAEADAAASAAADAAATATDAAADAAAAANAATAPNSVPDETWNTVEASEASPDASAVVKPAPGSDLPLSVGELRYCAFEKIRLLKLKQLITIDQEYAVTNFNARIDDYNSRCGSFKYRAEDMAIAQKDAEGARTALEGEAAYSASEWTR